MSLESDLLLLSEGAIVTLDPAVPRADWLVVAGDRIAGLGRGSPPALPAAGRRIDLGGATVLPGLIDPHAHLFGQVDTLIGVDCSPERVASIADLQAAIADRAAQSAPDAWIRANDYNEFHLAESRHPTRWDLDGPAGGRPVRLQHISRHVLVLNSPALAAAGIDENTPDPPGGRIERDPATGTPTGVLYEMNAQISRAVLPHLSEAELIGGLAAVSERYLRHGVTAVHDATTRNGLAEWQLYHGLIEDRRIGVRLQMMFGPDALDDFRAAGIGPRAGTPDLRLGALKILLAGHDGENEVDRARLPDLNDLARTVAAGQLAGFQVAIHAYDEWSVHLAVSALEEALETRPRSDHRHRIEHASVCPDWLAGRIRRLGCAVVTQPAFLARNGDRYLAQLHPDWIPSFYRVGGLLRQGIPVAASSDCPVGPMDPRLILYGAWQRRAPSGRVLAPEEAIPPRDALTALTTTAAWVGFDETDLGSLAPGKLADLAVFDRDLTAVSPEELLDAECVLTVRGGEIVWNAETIPSAEGGLK